MLPECVIDKLYEYLRKVYPGVYKNVSFDHEDASGYWFNFEIEAYCKLSKYTYCVRKYDI